MGKIILQESVGFNTASVLIQLDSFLEGICITDCFNTASVLIQLFRRTAFTRERRVSIQLLFLFNDNCPFSPLPFSKCFNTASVLIQRESGSFDIASYKFQYSFCSYSTLFSSLILNSYASFNTASVLIQPIFFLSCTNIVLFQYSFCSYSTNVVWSRSTVWKFQYSFCSYSTSAHGGIPAGTTLFQYSFCSYSTRRTLEYEELEHRFNTASVLIQPFPVK